MTVEQIYTGCLAEAAYYIVSEGEAAIIDPLRETQPYIDKLEKDGVQLKYIFETHFHADFVSGHLDLAEKTGATIVYGPGAATDFEKYETYDGEELSLGAVTFKVLHTPGHTLESTTFLLRDEQGKDFAIFTGDTLFIGDVGRPDLAQKAGKITVEDLASMAFDSLRKKILPLADEVIVYPGHGAGSACGKNMSKETWDTLGNQKRVNYALRPDMSREAFIKEVTSGLAPPPQYFAKNAALNKRGYQNFDEVLAAGSLPLNAEEFETLVNETGAIVLDTRRDNVFAEAHIPNSIFIGIDGGFAPWVGALITDLHQPIAIVAPEGRAEEVVTRLSRVGYDNTIGYLEGGIAAWQAAGKELESIESIPANTLSDFLAEQPNAQVLDVRKPNEFISQHLDVATNFPLDYINRNMNKLDRQQTYVVHCAGGYRSMIFASILQARGWKRIVDVQGGWKAIQETDLAKTDYVCPTEVPQIKLDEALQSVLN